MAFTVSKQAPVERNEMRFEYATLTFTTTAADGTLTLLDKGWGEPDFIISNTQFATAAENEEILTIDAYNSTTGVVTIRRDGHSTLISAAVYNVLLIWKA